MPRKTIQRTKEEQEEFQRVRRDRNAAYQRKYRVACRNQQRYSTHISMDQLSGNINQTEVEHDTYYQKDQNNTVTEVGIPDLQTSTINTNLSTISTTCNNHQYQNSNGSLLESNMSSEMSVIQIRDHQNEIFHKQTHDSRPLTQWRSNEEQERQRIRREKNATYQREYRAKRRNQRQNSNRIIHHVDFCDQPIFNQISGEIDQNAIEHDISHEGNDSNHTVTEIEHPVPMSNIDKNLPTISDITSSNHQRQDLNHPLLKSNMFPEISVIQRDIHVHQNRIENELFQEQGHDDRSIIQQISNDEKERQRIRLKKNAAYRREYRAKRRNQQYKSDVIHQLDTCLQLTIDEASKGSHQCAPEYHISHEENHNNNDIMPGIKIPVHLSIDRSDTHLPTIDAASNNYDSHLSGRSRSNTICDTTGQESKEHYIGPMNVVCRHCRAKHFAAEKVRKDSFNDCCSHGEVALEPLPNPPLILRDLFNGTHEQSKHFHERIRCYNNAFAFASFNANLVNFSDRRPGPVCFKLHGQVYYQFNKSLYPESNETPCYGQLFIIDPDEATDVRCNLMSTLNREVVEAIDNSLRQCNLFAQSYRMMHEELQSMRNVNTNEEPEMQLIFSLKPGIDQRRYNLQRINEVAAIFTTAADGDMPESYVSVRNKGTKELQFVNSMDPNVEPWIYPLFYPHGTQGWNKNLPCVNRAKRVSRAAYTKYRMADRDDNMILKGGRLFQQWVVDSYVKIEKDRLNYCRQNQKTLRSDTYQGLVDHLQQRANGSDCQVGKMIILPSTFTGSPRNMLQNYQDAMAIVRKFGKPDLFITMTCNPNWIEIKENLLPGQTASDRPDIVSRVFDIKKEELIKDVIKKNLFGEVCAYVYVIEYQKRGLPHMHLLVNLKQNNKIVTPDAVDRYISAEIPDRETDTILYNIVLKDMIHGPCGSWCKDEKGKCTKNFPKKYQENTSMDENGYPTYRRRNTGTYERSNGQMTDNAFVVPYNPYLLEKFTCHINVEIVSSIKSVKYLYKYIYKGHDSASVIVSNTENQNEIHHDEIRNFIDTRYVSPVEACDRIYGRPIQHKSHSVMRLPVHLPNQQNITINEFEDEDGLRSALEKTSMLMEYFSLNQRDPEARNYTYGDIPSHYVYKKLPNSNEHRWEKRKAHFNTIGRMYSISPTQLELFHLRLLLIAVKGATSFEDLTTVNGQLCNTFHSTCLALGLIEDDREWERALTEGEIWMMPRQLRHLFVRILIYGHPNHPEVLWEQFKDAFSQDFQRNYNESEAQKRAYAHINTILMNERSSLSAFATMPPLDEYEVDVNDGSDDQMSIEIHETIGHNQYAQLNTKQKEIVDKILNIAMSTEELSSSCFYIDGPGGSGKTFVYTTLYHLLKAQGKSICTMAFTGIAAILLPQGKTLHKTFGIPVPILPDSVSNIKSQSKEAEYLRNVDFFIWDEAPMAPRSAMELIDRTLRDLMDTHLPFGGKIMLLGGDFRQLLPVTPNATRCELVNSSIKFSHLWKNFLIFSLTENMRALPGEAEFAKYLLLLGDGKLNDTDDNLLPPEQCIASNNDDIVEVIFKKLIDERRFGDLAKTAVLAARNVDVDEINCNVTKLLDETTERLYTGIDSVENCDNGDINDAILPEYLNTLNPPNFPPHELRLRKDSIVMLLRNLSINEGLCNGTRLQIIELANNLLRCRILNGDKMGDIVFINRVTLYCENIFPFTFKRRQFPVKLGFAMTINKSQGQTFDKIGIDLRKDVFNHGQLYVAFSRVCSWETLKIFLGSERDSNTVKNWVYTELYK
ncbi:uncharacterized protein LOC135169496 [Diachasmimorpha longicaudata]|uniref:uncharacterized protein LOC135169496 n=1 Tax=Diachasmimorpha longicaudata TaxID=58733 RepID=UPI0030B8D490